MGLAVPTPWVEALQSLESIIGELLADMTVVIRGSLEGHEATPR